MNNETPAEARIASRMPDPRETARSIHQQVEEIERNLHRAAPDMLEALQLIVAEWNSCPMSTQYFDFAIIRMAKAAMLKAQGRESEPKQT